MSEADADSSKTWVQRDFGLDRRLIKALSKLGYVYPTLVQARTIPLVLHGKDVVVRARTGSGKTVAFALPILQKILIAKGASAEGGSSSSSGGGPSSSSSSGTQCVILVPTKELCKQIEKHVTDLLYYCRDVIHVAALADDNTSTQAIRLKSRPEIVISTPAKLVQHLLSGAADLSACKTLVIDEADLVLSFGYAEDIHQIKLKMPKIFQGLLMSATLSPELEKFKKMTLHNPAILKLEEEESSGHLVQFYLNTRESDKFLILFVFLRLGLLQGKGLVFLNDVNKAYRLKLFLQQFGIQAAVLNSEIPLNSRTHILDEFNRGLFEYLIATDASLDDGEDDVDDDDAEEEEEEEGEGEGEGGYDDSDGAMDRESADGEDEEDEGKGKDKDKGKDKGKDTGKGKSKGKDKTDVKSNSKSAAAAVAASAAISGGKRKASAAAIDSDEQYGVSRGIDFVGVSFVINFDFPKTAAAYTHRIGRTARGGASGTALSFVASVDPGAKAGPEADAAYADAKVLHAVRASQPRLNSAQSDSVLAAMGAVDDPAFADSNDSEAYLQPAPLLFDIRDVDSFRYRVEDTLRSVTPAKVQEFRAAEIKRELLNSAKLKAYFASNPGDLKVLRHDLAVAHPIRRKEHLKHVPDYLIPASMRGAAGAGSSGGSGAKKKRRKVGGQAEKRIQQSKMKDPLMNAGAVEGEGGGEVDGGGDGDRDEAQAAGPSGGKIFTQSELARQSEQSTSGRRAWQQRHKKGKFNPNAAKKNSHRVEGAFVKSKKYK